MDICLKLTLSCVIVVLYSKQCPKHCWRHNISNTSIYYFSNTSSVTPSNEMAENASRVGVELIGICITLFTDKIALLNHSVFNVDALNAVVSRRQTEFPCPKCDSIYNRKNNLQKHLRYECGQSPRFKCPYCIYLSKKTSNVRTHIRGIHPGCSVFVIDLTKTSA